MRIVSARSATSPAELGQHDVARAALHQLAADLTLQLADLHGERRLGDGAVLSRPAEMAVAGERSEIAKLPQSDHGDKIILIAWARSIRLDLIEAGR